MQGVPIPTLYESLQSHNACYELHMLRMYHHTYGTRESITEVTLLHYETAK